MGLASGMTFDRLADRRELLRAFDTIRRDLDDVRGSLAGMDAFTSQAMEMIASNKARLYFDRAPIADLEDFIELAVRGQPHSSR